MRRLLLMLAMVVIALFAVGAGPNDVRLANDLYKQGHERVRANDWEGARDDFARAYALYPQPVILVNLAGAEVQTGHLVQAVEHYRLFLKNTSGMDRSDVELAKKTMESVEARLAHLRITVANTTPNDTIELDGRVLPSAALDTEYPVDPGKHVARVMRNGAEDARAEVTLAEGEAKNVRLVAKQVVATEPPPPPPEEKKKSGSIFASPWFWVATGVVVVGTATAICLGAVCREKEGYSGNLGAVKLP